MGHPVPEQGKQEPLWFGCDIPWAVAVRAAHGFIFTLFTFSGSSFPLCCPKPHKFLVLQCFHGSLCRKRNFGNVFPDMRKIIMKVQRSWGSSHFDHWEKNCILKKSELYSCSPQPQHFTVTALKWCSSRLVLSNPGHFRGRIFPSRKI